MNNSLRILHLEDNPLDSELLQATLEEAGICCDIRRVETRAAFVEALEVHQFDLILSDYSLPSFDGISALAIAREKRSEIPFLIVTGTLGEEVAIETLKSGATDYVLKHRLSRLVPSVRRALREAETRAERQRLEEQFRQSQKMEAIGRLAGGIAHDFNNLLSVIIGYSGLLISHLEQDHPHRKEIEEIEKAGKRAASLTTQLLTFSRKQVLRPVDLDLNLVISEMERMLRRIIGEHIDLVTALGSGVPLVRADQGQMEQIIMNLAVNARDAMPQGGKLTIATSSVVLDEGYAMSHAEVKPGHFVLLSISDNGVGMSKQIQARIFEPFFTTKEPDKGTGLGLATVYGIIKQSNGHIWVYSEEGHGTTFKIYLPSFENGLRQLASDESRAGIYRGSETILLVEDEEALRNLARRVFELNGYTVVQASNGKEAIECCKRHRGRIDLVVTDVIMPQMGGVELAQRLQIAYPRVKILFVTGYTDDTIRYRGVLEKGAALLQKPFSPDALARKVREVLDVPVT